MICSEGGDYLRIFAIALFILLPATTKTKPLNLQLLKRFDDVNKEMCSDFTTLQSQVMAVRRQTLQKACKYDVTDGTKLLRLVKFLVLFMYR